VTPAADTAAKDTAPPVKKGRFGRFINKAKEVKDSKAVQAVANNKTVQAVAKNETVQTAAKGVACNVVPGAALVTAATGSGPCVNAGLTAALMGGNLGGMTGLSNAAATANALKMIKGAGTSGVSNTLALTQAMQMMQKNGMSNVAAAAALTAMLKSPDAAGMSSSDIQAVLKMLNGMQVPAKGK
jgi:hypothetical protein